MSVSWPCQEDEPRNVTTHSQNTVGGVESCVVSFLAEKVQEPGAYKNEETSDSEEGEEETFSLGGAVAIGLI